MPDSWWKKLLSIDESNDPAYWDTPRHGETVKKGRIGDPERRVQVKMVSQYPQNDIRLDQTHKKINKKELTRTKEQKENSRVVPKGKSAEKPVQQKFKPTSVPSPIYGFRERPIKGTKNGLSVPAFQRREQDFPLTDEHSEETKGTSDVSVPENNNMSEKEMALFKENSRNKSSEQAKIPDAEPEQETNTDIEETITEDSRENGVEETERKLVQDQEDYSNPSSLSHGSSTSVRSSKKPVVPFNVLMNPPRRFRKDISPSVRERGEREEEPHSEKRAETPKHKEIPADKNSHPLEQEETDQQGIYFRPSLDLLSGSEDDLNEEDNGWRAEKEEILKQTLNNFNVKGKIVDVIQGPTVTRFEIKLHPGVKVNKIIGLTEDIKLSLAARQLRIAPVPGKNTVGIEVPNDARKPVYLKQLLQSQAFQNSPSPLTAALGRDVSGKAIVTDLAKMPHGLIAGATGSGKSVCIHSLILSLIYKATPEELRLILIDPKVVELAAYQKLPHLAAPVLTQPKEASLALKWAVEEMEKRYQQFAKHGVRDITKFNQAARSGKITEASMPYIVIIIDELADLMMISPQDVEEAICRIAQKARAAGIHLLLATQRPSVDVITGLIKSNIPTRIAFSVSSQADSRTILDTGGAERLLGQGDMLFSENGARSLKRVQGCFVSDEEIDLFTGAITESDYPPYLFDGEALTKQEMEFEDDEDELFVEAGRFVLNQGQASISSLQRRFRIGYNRAARLIDQLERREIISEANGSKPRQVMVSESDFEEMF